MKQISFVGFGQNIDGKGWVTYIPGVPEGMVLSLTYWHILKGPQNQHNQGVAQWLEQISNSYFTQLVSSFALDAGESHDSGQT